MADPHEHSEWHDLLPALGLIAGGCAMLLWSAAVTGVGRYTAIAIAVGAAVGLVAGSAVRLLRPRLAHSRARHHHRPHHR